MAILGGGGQSVDDPVYVDTLESLKEVLVDGVNLYKYIAFPEVYDGPKVIDLRSAGWNPINIQAPSNANRDKVHVYFNNWTILGLSMMDSLSPFKTFINVYEIEMNIYDLIIKNAYILAATSEATLFNCSEGTADAIINFYRCKFSMCIDAQNSNVTAFHGFANGGYHGGRHMNFYQCSFNVNYVVNTERLLARLYYQDYVNGSFTNCIFNIVASHHRGSSGYSGYLVALCKQMQFCKIVGSIDHVNGDGIDVLELSDTGGSVYNVVDMDIIDHVLTSNVNLTFRFNRGTNIIDSSKVYKVPEAGTTVALSKNYSNLTECTTAQMQDKDYLNSIEFTCGDTPSDAPPHKRRLIFNTHLHERRCA